MDKILFFLNTIIKFENECTLENSSSISNTRAILLRRRKIYVSIEKDVHVDKDSESSPEGEINSEWINYDRDKEESEEWEKSKSL